MSNTEVFIDEFKGYPVFAIWAVDSIGNKSGGKPVVSFGLNKALAILKHLDEVEQWVNEEQETRQQSKFNKKPQQSYSSRSSAKKPIISLKKKIDMPYSKRIEKEKSIDDDDNSEQEPKSIDFLKNTNLTAEQIELLRMFSRK